MAGLEIENSFGVLALDQQQWRDLRNGYGVAPSTALGTLNGECEVTINGTGDLGTGNSALSVGSGTVLFGGTTTSVSAQNVDIDAGQSNPRKDVVYIDTNGDAQVRKGSPASVPSDAPGNRFQTWKPAPYDMHDVDAVVLAEVWVPANASSIGSSDVRDRRLRADLETRAFATEELNNIIVQGDSESVADAIGRASSGDKVLLQAGTFSESITISTADVTVEGVGRGTLINGGASDAIETSADGIMLSNLAVKTTAGGGNTARGIRVGFGSNEVLLENIWVEESDEKGISISGTDCRILSVFCDSANIDSTDVVLESNSNTSVADDIIGTVSDSGTGNTVGETA